MGGSAIGGDLAARRARRPAHPADARLPRLRAALLDARRTAPCSARATRATPRRRSPASPPPRRSAPAAIVATTGGALAEAAREADGVPVIGLPGGPAAARRGRLQLHGRGRGRRARRRRRRASGPRSTLGAAHLEAERDSLVAAAAEIAEQLAGTVPLIYGCDLTAPVAYRWKTQINENAKLPAFEHQLPELDHNEIVGWSRRRARARFSAIFLDDPDQHPRQRERVELTAKLIGRPPAAVVRVETEGETRVRAPALGGDARRPRLARARRPQRRSTPSRST